ncbi:hypothetical protein ACA910_018319 [Epithemia clementina (nom. ined.)]
MSSTYFYYHRVRSSNDMFVCIQCETKIASDCVAECGQCQDICCIDCTDNFDCNMCLEKERNGFHKNKKNNRGSTTKTGSSSRKVNQSPPLPIVPTCCEACEDRCGGCHRSFHSVCLLEHVKYCTASAIGSATETRLAQAATVVREKKIELLILRVQLERIQGSIRVVEKDLEVAMIEKAVAEELLHQKKRQQQSEKEEKELGPATCKDVVLKDNKENTTSSQSRKFNTAQRDTSPCFTKQHRLRVGPWKMSYRPTDFAIACERYAWD